MDGAGYAIATPVAYLGTVTPVGLAGLGLAIILEMVTAAIVNYYRFSPANGRRSIGDIDNTKSQRLKSEFKPRGSICDWKRESAHTACYRT